jgi:cytochrome c
MEDRFNTIAGWTLFSGIVALGLASLSSKYFEAGKHHRPHEMGYAIEGVVASGGGGKAEQPIEALLAVADPAKGEATFKKCMSCHTINAGGAAGLGPNLHGVVGKAVAGGAFAFSDALKAKGGKWDWATLNEWLKNPAAFAKGTKMTFAGISGGEERANLMAYMNAQGSNLPMPAAPAAEAEAAPAEGEAAAAAPAAVEPAAH